MKIVLSITVVLGLIGLVVWFFWFGKAPQTTQTPQTTQQDKSSRSGNSQNFAHSKWQQEASNLLGFADSNQLKIIDTSKGEATDILVPFLGTGLAGKSAVFIELEAPSVSFKGEGKSHMNTKLKKIRCSFLEITGQLIQVTIEENDVQTLPGEMSQLKAEERYQLTSEQYHDLAPEVAPISLQAILHRIMDYSPAAVWESKKIVARYIVNSRKGILNEDSRWILNFYGFPPMPTMGISDATADERSHLRMVFSKEGEFISGDNQP